MSEEVSYIPEPPESFEAVPEQKKNNKTLWIILVVAAVVLLCCCLVIVLIAVLGLIPASYDQYFYELLPYLQLA
jgi:flagellar basal body-associated protein FliL